MPINWDDRYEQLGHLPENTLYDLIRNPSTPVDFRQVAAEIMVANEMPKAKTSEVQQYLPSTTAVEPTVTKTEAKAENKTKYSGPLKASVTTTSLLQPEVVAEPVQKTDK